MEQQREFNQERRKEIRDLETRIRQLRRDGKIDEKKEAKRSLKKLRKVKYVMEDEGNDLELSLAHKKVKIWLVYLQRVMNTSFRGDANTLVDKTDKPHAVVRKVRAIYAHISEDELHRSAPDSDDEEGEEEEEESDEGEDPDEQQLSDDEQASVQVPQSGKKKKDKKLGKKK